MPPLRRAWPALLAYAGLACGTRTGLDANAREGISADASSDAPHASDAAAGVTRRTLSMSWGHACAITAGGGVTCWGDNAQGLVGPDAPLHAPPTPVSGIHGAIEVAVGQIMSCALLGDQTVSCWGEAVGSRRPIWISRLPRARRIFAGAATVCVLTDAKTVACAGVPLSTGSTCASISARAAFDAVSFMTTLSNVVEVAIGRVHACALESDGGVWCWGCGASGVLGSLTQPSTTTPVRVAGVTAAHIASETGAVCTLSASGDATCWGDGSQFGTSLTVAPTSPRPVSLGAGAFDVDVGVVFTCGARTDQVTCAGSLYDFGAGCGNRTVATRAFAVPGVREISIGYQDACARDARGEVWCWGCNMTGAVGDATLTAHDAPFRVPM